MSIKTIVYFQFELEDYKWNSTLASESLNSQLI